MCIMVFLVRGHTKKSCNRTFALLKQYFHYNNIYTKNWVCDNLNKNEHFEVVHVSSYVFYESNGRLVPYYNNCKQNQSIVHTFLHSSMIIQVSSNFRTILQLQFFCEIWKNIHGEIKWMFLAEIIFDITHAHDAPCVRAISRKNCEKMKVTNFRRNSR